MNCVIKDCEKEGNVPGTARGMCRSHYKRWIRYGDPLLFKRIREDHVSRFWSKVNKKGDDDCWDWIGCLSNFGYGHFSVMSDYIPAHRYSYELIVGIIPENLVIDHLCRNRKCVNPKHLEPVTDQVNILRGVGRAAIHAKKTHCIHGHPFDEINTRFRIKGDRNWRVCRVCKRESDIRIRDKNLKHSG